MLYEIGQNILYTISRVSLLGIIISTENVMH